MFHENTVQRKSVESSEAFHEDGWIVYKIVQPTCIFHYVFLLKGYLKILLKDVY